MRQKNEMVKIIDQHIKELEKSKKVWSDLSVAFIPCGYDGLICLLRELASQLEKVEKEKKR